MAWTIEFTPEAARQLKKLDRSLQQRTLAYLEALLSECTSPRQRGKGLKAKLSGLWRYRVGDLRVICRIQDSTMVVLVVEVGKRSEIYS